MDIINNQNIEIQQELSDNFPNYLRLKYVNVCSSKDQMQVLREYLQSNQQISTLNLSFESGLQIDILEGFYKLSNLTKLDLSFNSVTLNDNQLRQIIEVFCNNSTLQSLCLTLSQSFLQLSSNLEEFQNLFQSFTQLKQVKIVSDHNLYSIDGFKKVVGSILACPTISDAEIIYYQPFTQIFHISLTEPQNYSQFIDQISHSITKVNITFPDMADKQSLAQISENFKYLPNLTYLSLDISEAKNEDKCLQQFLLNFDKLNQLKKIEFNFSRIEFTFEELQQLSISLSKQVNLEELILNLSECSDVGEAFGNVELIFANCLSLQKLSLQFDYCIDTDLNELAIHVSKATNLKSLKINVNDTLQGNQFAINLGKSLQQLSQLQEIRLFLSQNKITDEGVKEIAQGISDKDNLEQFSIHLHNNLVSQVGYSYVKQSLANKKRLINIDQDFKWNNSIDTESSLEILGNEIHAISNLEYTFNDQNITPEQRDILTQQLKMFSTIDTLLIFYIKQEFFTINSNLNQSLPVRTHLQKLKRLFIFSSFSEGFKKKLRQFFIRKSFRLLELTVGDW